MADDYDKPFELAEAMLGALVLGLEDDAPARRMVSWPGAADDCEQLTVAPDLRSWLTPSVSTRGTQGSTPAVAQKGSVPAVPQLVLVVRFVHECWPVMADEHVPTPEEIGEQAARGFRRFYRCWKVARTLRESGALFAGELPTEKAAGVTVSGLVPVPVAGNGMIGATFTVTANLLIIPTPTP